MNRHLLLVALAATVAACSANSGSDENTGSSTEDQSAVTSYTFGQGDNVIRGLNLFLNPFPGTDGNGRSCATCHVPSQGFGLTPAHAEARYQALQAARKTNPNADDPLFRSIDANDGKNDYTFLRQWGLVKVNIKLPPNVKMLDQPGATEVGLWRSTPTVFNVAVTAPYQLDGRVTDLPTQALGALHGHAQIKHAPTSQQLNDVSAFERFVFPNAYTFVVAQAVQNNRPVPPEPPVFGQAVLGKQVFNRECSACHGGPALNQTVIPADAQPGNVMVSRPLPPFADPSIFLTGPDLPVHLYEVTLPDGSTMVQPSTDPGRVLITGDPNDFNGFDIPQLRGLSKTAPYFHDNSAKSIDDVVKHYQALFTTLAALGVPAHLDDNELAPLAAYLRTL